VSSTPTIARRKPRDQRRAEILQTASRIAIDKGLDNVTARRIADALGVYPGLISHYFATADELIAAAFAHAAAAEREQVFGKAETAATPTEQIGRLLHEWLDPARDAVSLLWLDAWQASRRRPALRRAVTEQMTADLDRLQTLIETGQNTGDFHVDNAGKAVMRILALIDGLSVQAATRENIDYSTVAEMVLTTTEDTLGLRPGTLRL
jgi:AcrR family transcriptional regulator